MVLIIENESDLLSLEIKSSSKLNRDDFTGLKRFAEFHKKAHRSILIYSGERNYKEDKIDVLSWKKGLAIVSDFMK